MRYLHLCVPVLLSLASAFSAAAQTTNVTIATNIAGPSFSVDGVIYYGAATFTWQIGSQHNIDIPFDRDSAQYGGMPNERQFHFTGWTGSSGAALSGTRFTITAGFSETYYTANFKVFYRVNILFGPRSINGGPNGAACGSIDPSVPNVPRVGTVTANGNCFWADGGFWMEPGTVTLLATPFAQSAFKGWVVNGGQPSLTVNNVPVNSPTTILAMFEPGQHFVLRTQPMGLAVTVDGNRIETSATEPCELTPQPTEYGGAPVCKGDVWLAPGTTHTIGVPSPQQDLMGRFWIFKQWSNGFPQEVTIRAASTTTAQNWVAEFGAAARVRVVSQPDGIPLVVDGTPTALSIFTWAAGSKHTVSAPAEGTDASGRRYRFKGWANAGADTQEFVVTEQMAATGGYTLAAVYEAVSMAVVESTVGATVFIVDGAECPTPCFIDKKAGETVEIIAPAVVQESDVTRLDFQGWPNGDTGPLRLTLGEDFQVISARYYPAHRLLIQSNPEDGLDYSTTPFSPDGFYSEGSVVAISAAARNGYRFLHWEEGLQGTDPNGYIELTHPRTVRAALKPVPYVGGMVNAAGEGPEPGVAAGSLVKIWGENMAPVTETGPASPLSQLISGVAVRVDDRVLPLVSVSPKEIVALLPSDLPEGLYTAAVNATGAAEVSTEFQVVRNAPGLFFKAVDEQNWAVAYHEDGKPVTAASRARRGERVTLMGTGFGPYDRAPIDGFAVPAKPQYTLVDKVELVAGEKRIPVLWGGAHAGAVGMTAIRFRIGDELPSGTAELRAVTGGRESNTVLLPVE